MKITNYSIPKLLFGATFYFFSTFLAEATIHTVDNQPNSGAQFSDLQEAIDAAAGGDTLYVAGSPTSYGAITVNKKLAIIGAGYKVDNQWGLATNIGRISLTRKLDEFSNVQSSASNSYFAGLNVTSDFYSSNSNSFAITGIGIDRCQFIGITQATCSGSFLTSFSVSNSIFSHITLSACGGTESTLYNVTVNNSIIASSGGKILSSNSASNILFNNCIFKGGSLENSRLAYVIFTNCIMYNTITSGAAFCTFTNNISYSTNPAAPESETAFVYGTNTGENNIVNTDPLFQNIAGATFSFTDDLRLQAGAPGIDAGSDGTDIGLYGGSFPFPVGGEGEFLMAAPPKIPQIYEMNVQNATLPENGSLNVRVKARKQN